MRSVSFAFVGPILVAGMAGCALLSGVGDLAIVDDAGSSGVAPDGSIADSSLADGGDAHPDATTLDAPPPSDAAEAGTDSAPGAEAGTDAASGPCSGKAGPTPVRVGSFCIDATEVTNDQYAAFLAANPAVSLAPAVCSFKTSFTPSQSWPASASKASHPVVFVDWCDAAAYCTWAGKRLCGAIAGGQSARASAGDKNVDAWYVACSGGGASVYPYGGASYLTGKCNDAESNTHGTRPVASFAGCQGGFPGIFDMNGNVWEWEDACDVTAGASDACLIRGGSWLFTGAQYGGCPTYFNDYVVKRSDNFNDTGFRCCSK